MRRIIKKLPVFFLIVLILVASFQWGENSQVTEEPQISQPQINVKNEEPMLAESTKKEEKVPDAELPMSEKEKESPVAVVTEKLPKKQEEKLVLPENNEKKETVQAEKKLVCSFSVSCNTALANIARLVPEKQPLIPSDGILYKREDAVFEEGDSVFDLLLREMTAAGIHMEFAKTPMYGNVYIEGIGNLYEFDCGELSGWMYRVNGVFPNFGCDGYKLKSGDEVEWVYTCNLGRDVGGDYAAQNGE